jgi:hypothetical protein
MILPQRHLKKVVKKANSMIPTVVAAVDIAAAAVVDIVVADIVAVAAVVVDVAVAAVDIAVVTDANISPGLQGRGF